MNSKIIYEIDNKKKCKNKNNLEQLKEYSLKRSIINPSKDSPNLFITKLEHRMKNYYLEVELNNSPPFSLDTK